MSSKKMLRDFVEMIASGDCPSKIGLKEITDYHGELGREEYNCFLCGKLAAKELLEKLNREGM